MMSKLRNLSKNSEIAHTVMVADSLYLRLKGLLGESSIEPGKALWIHRCNNIHTWFMRFPIDVIFVDKKMIVKSKVENLKPWRLSLPVWRAYSVFEMAAGTLRTTQVAIGDQLYVGD